MEISDEFQIKVEDTINSIKLEKIDSPPMVEKSDPFSISLIKCEQIKTEEGTTGTNGVLYVIVIYKEK